MTSLSDAEARLEAAVAAFDYDEWVRDDHVEELRAAAIDVGRLRAKDVDAALAPAVHRLSGHLDGLQALGCAVAIGTFTAAGIVGLILQAFR